MKLGPRRVYHQHKPAGPQLSSHYVAGADHDAHFAAIAAANGGKGFPFVAPKFSTVYRKSTPRLIDGTSRRGTLQP